MNNYSFLAARFTSFANSITKKNKKASLILKSKRFLVFSRLT